MILIVWLTGAIFPLAAQADFRNAPFALRVFLALDRQSNYVSTLAQQASVALLDGSSANPASTAWRDVTQLTTTATASYVDAPSTGGYRIEAIPVSVRWQFPEQGTLALAYAYTDTPDAQGNSDLRYSLRSNEWSGGYSARISDSVATGFTVRYTDGQLIGDSNVAAFGNQTIRSTEDFKGPDAELGVARSVDSRVSLGLVAGYGVVRSKSRETNVQPLFLPLPPSGVTLPPGTLLEEGSDTVSTFTIRAGAGFRPDDATGIYVDANGLYASTRHNGSLSLGRFALGVDHNLSLGWALRGGVSVDTNRQVNWSVGTGYRLAPTIDAEFAFQNNSAPEVNKELGRTRLFAVSLAGIF